MIGRIEIYYDLQNKYSNVRQKNPRVILIFIKI